LFVLSRADGSPIKGAPFYAEVVAPTPIPEPPVEIDHRIDDLIAQQLRELDPSSFADPTSRQRIIEAIQDAIARLLPTETRDHLADDANRATQFLQALIDIPRRANGGTLKNLPEADLRRVIKKSVSESADRLGLAINPPMAPALITKTAYPLGILATDHAGYLSFDLKRLPSDVYESLVAAVEQRRQDANAIPDTSVWLYGMAKENLRFDALAQGRFAADVILTKIEVETPFALPFIARAAGFPAMQNPSLADWRISPASFAANPSALIGDEEGCENLLPAHVALQEYWFYQVIGLNDANNLAPAAVRDKVRIGVVHEFRVAWYPLGHSLGQILYSLPLAPGESVNLAVVDWTRRDDAQRKEQTTLDEQLVHQEHRDRSVTETVNAAIHEYQHGSSFMGGIAGSAGLGAAIGGAGIAAGISGALGGSTASSSGTREIAANTVQNISDNITQASAAQRELNSTVVVQSTQSEKEAIQTRTIVNYNHSHALTILYYEVLRHFRVVTEFVRRRPAVLVKMKTDWFAGADAARAVREHRAALQDALLDPSLAEAFNALDRIAHREQIAAIAPPPAPPPGPGDQAFVYFRFEMLSGGWVADYEHDGNRRIEVTARLAGPDFQLVNPDSAGTMVSPSGAFNFADAMNTFYAVLPADVKRVPWQEITAIYVGVTPVQCLASFKHIKITGIDGGGGERVLVDQDYGSGHLLFRDAKTIALPTARPPLPSPPPARPAEEIEDEASRTRLLAHVDYHRAHYSRAILFAQDAADRSLDLAAIALPDGTTIADKLENRPIEIIGEFVAYPCTDASWSTAIEHLIVGDVLSDEPLDERLVTLPTRGVFAEAKLGHCNASEEIDDTRFWDWQTSPIPHLAPEIAPVTPVTPQPQQQNLTPTPFPQSLINIVNPPSEPDPTGLAAALNVLGTPNIFRDMSGRAEVADLLKRLSDNTIGIADAANKARAIQQKYGSATGGTTSGGGGIGTGGTSRMPPPSVRDQNNQMKQYQKWADENAISPEKFHQVADEFAQSTADAYKASGDLGLQQAGYVPPDAYSPQTSGVSNLIGQAGEQTAANVFESEKLTVFRDWLATKNIATPGIDIPVLDDRSPNPEEWKVWLTDNKAQMKGISGASALTDKTNFEAYKQEVYEFLANKSSHSKAAQAAKLIKDGKFQKVVLNAWAGSNTTFTKRVFDSDLLVYDIRFRQLFTDYSEWRAAYKAFRATMLRIAGTRGTATVKVRGAASVEYSLVMIATIVVAGTTLYALRSDVGLLDALGEEVANTAFGLALSLLPGGFIAGLTVGLRSDETPSQAADRVRKETINDICSSFPGFLKLTDAEQKIIADEIGKMLDDPLRIDPPAAPSTPAGPKQILPGLFSPVPGPWA
jgi:hypothetical protein